jgi:hypothetical protein
MLETGYDTVAGLMASAGNKLPIGVHLTVGTR